MKKLIRSKGVKSEDGVEGEDGAYVKGEVEDSELEEGGCRVGEIG